MPRSRKRARQNRAPAYSQGNRSVRRKLTYGSGTTKKTKTKKRSYRSGKRRSSSKRSVSSRATGKKFTDRIMKSLTPLQTYTTRCPQVLDVTAGTSTTPNARIACTWLSTRPQLDLIAIFDLMYSRQNQLGISVSTFDAWGPNSYFLLERTIQRYYVTNQSVAKCNLEMYYCRARRDIPNETSYAQAENIIKDGFFDNNYYNDDTNPAGQVQPTNPLNDMSLTPFQSARFTAWWNIYKVKKRILEGGESIKFSCKSGRCKVRAFNIATSSQSANQRPSQWQSSWVHLKGAKVVVLKWFGQPSDAIVTGNANDAVVYTNPKLSIDVQTTHEYRWVQGISGNNDFNTYNFTTGNTLAYGTGAPQVVAEFGQNIQTETEIS